MNSSNRRSRHRHTLIASALVALLLPTVSLASDVCEADHELDPMTLRDQRIPTYEVFETFLLLASVVYDTHGTDAYRSFLRSYGLNPDLSTLQELPWVFDELQESLLHNTGHAEQRKAERVGQIFASVLDDIESDPTAIDAGRTFRLRLLERLRPEMSWVFIDESPDFAAIDEAEADFNQVLSRSAESSHAIGLSIAGESLVSKPSSGAQVKLSFLALAELGSAREHEEEGPVRLVEIAWHRYAAKDGSVRVFGVIDTGAQSLGIVDMTFRSMERLRPLFKQDAASEWLSFNESFLIEADIAEKSHTSLGCIAKSAAAAAACAACVGAPTVATCPACVIAIAVAKDACDNPHCNQIVCNRDCVDACHLYGWCSSTSGSSTPQDCRCYGLRFDTPQCAPPSGCNALVSQVSMLDLDGSQPTQLPSEPVSLRRLELSPVVHDGQQVRYLMGEWAILAYGAPTLATKWNPSVRALRSSSPDFAAAQSKALLRVNPAGVGSSSATGERITLVVATPPHEENSRDIPLPALEIAPVDLPDGAGNGRIVIRADFSEAGDLQDFQILYDTFDGLSPQLVARIEAAISIKRLTDKEHRVVAFAVLTVGESVELESKLLYLPKCCCGPEFCA